MKKEDIITLPHPSLRQRSKKVGYISDDIRKLVADMQEATLDWEASRTHEVGVALAAIQVNEPCRVVVVRNNLEDKQDRSFLVLINPEITKYEGEIVEDYEGCLSVVDIYGKIPRFNKVRVKALDVDGREFRLTATGFLARIFQHEIDHTNGIVFIDHIRDKHDAFYKLKKDGSLEELSYGKEISNNEDLWN